MRVALCAVLFVAAARASAQDAQDYRTGGILYLGDSESEGPFGGTLYDAFRAMRDPLTNAPLHVKVFAKCGAGADDWLVKDKANIDCGAWSCKVGVPRAVCPHFMGGTIPPLGELYDELGSKRRVTVVALGINMLIGRRDSNRDGTLRQQKLADAANLIAAIRKAHSACIWIGPPQPGDLFVDDRIYRSFLADLAAVAKENDCRYIASDDKTDRRLLGQNTRDNHYGRDDAVAWARKVLNELDNPRDSRDGSLLDLLRENPN
jgi:hypothetical protein